MLDKYGRTNQHAKPVVQTHGQRIAFGFVPKLFTPERHRNYLRTTLQGRKCVPRMGVSGNNFRGKAVPSASGKAVPADKRLSHEGFSSDDLMIWHDHIRPSPNPALPT